MGKIEDIRLSSSESKVKDLSEFLKLECSSCYILYVTSVSEIRETLKYFNDSKNVVCVSTRGLSRVVDITKYDMLIFDDINTELASSIELFSFYRSIIERFTGKILRIITSE